RWINCDTIANRLRGDGGAAVNDTHIAAISLEGYGVLTAKSRRFATMSRSEHSSCAIAFSNRDRSSHESFTRKSAAIYLHQSCPGRRSSRAQDPKLACIYKGAASISVSALDSELSRSRLGE